jgi:TPR repeat protein
MNLAETIDRLRYGRPEALRRSAERSFARGENAAALLKLQKLGTAATEADLFRLGECYEKGIGTLPNPARAVHWYEEAAERGYLPAMERLGEIYLSGREIPPVPGGGGAARAKRVSVKRDHGKAFRWNSRAAEGGMPEAQARLGSQYATGLGATADRELAERWFRASAEKDSAAGQFGLGALYSAAYSGISAEQEAVRWFEKSAEKGNTAAQMCLAMALLDGRGTPPDAPRGLKLMTKAAEGGQIEAMFRLGQLYRRDDRIEKNISQAESWLRRAGIRGHGSAPMALTQLLIEDLPAPDYMAAAVVLRDSAEHNDPQAQFELGRLYAAGRGVVKDFEEAKRWLLKAAEAGIAEASSVLALVEEEAVEAAKAAEAAKREAEIEAAKAAENNANGEPP